jgi:hypothetical protein
MTVSALKPTGEGAFRQAGDLHPCHSILHRNPRPELRDVLREFMFEYSLEK